jgi:hypothetical protein
MDKYLRVTEVCGIALAIGFQPVQRWSERTMSSRRLYQKPVDILFLLGLLFALVRIGFPVCTDCGAAISLPVMVMVLGRVDSTTDRVTH